jgi:hypothetical protein
MAQLENMETIEARIARKLAKLMQGQVKDVMAALGDPPDFNNIDPEVWAKMKEETEALLLPEAEQTYLAAAEQAAGSQPIGIDDGEANERAIAWAAAHVATLTAGLERTTQNAVQRKVSAFSSESDSISDLKKSIQSVLGPVRAETIAITESTLAAAEGELETVRQLTAQGANVTVIWETSADEAVCPICGPLQGTERGDGWTDPPPAHVRCRCWLNFKFDGDSTQY